MQSVIFDDIVSGFYRAATGCTDWSTALQPFQRALAAFAIHLHGVDAGKGRIAFSHVATDASPEGELDYLRRYHAIDPRAALAVSGEVGTWMNCWEHFDDAFVAADRFYQEFLIPYGGRYVSGTKLLEAGDICVILGVHRGGGAPVLNGEEIGDCQRLARHLTDALVIHGETVQQRNTGRFGMELLSRLPAAALLIDEERRLQHVNPAAEALLAASDALVRRSGRLFCASADDDHALMFGLRKLLRAATRPTDRVVTDRLFLRAESPGGAAPTGLFLEALQPDKTLHAFGDQPLAMLLLQAPGQRLQLDPFVVAAVFDLTPAEARVAVAAATGAATDEIALRHRVSPHTVRSQLRVVFEKTGVARQAELVSLLAALPTAALAKVRTRPLA